MKVPGSIRDQLKDGIFILTYKYMYYHQNIEYFNQTFDFFKTNQSKYIWLIYIHIQYNLYVVYPPTHNPKHLDPFQKA